MFQQSPFSPHLTSKYLKNTPIHSGYTLEHLPTSYLQLLLTQGYGYFINNKIKTTEPTRDGIDYVLCNGIFSWESIEPFASILDHRYYPQETGLPEYFIIFFQDDEKYFCFDYSLSTNPSIRFIDKEMDQWLQIATSFEDFLEKLQPHREVSLPSSIHEANHGFYQPENLSSYLEHYQDSSNKYWYLTWIYWYLVTYPELNSPLFEAIEFQLEYMSFTLFDKKILELLKQMANLVSCPHSIKESIQQHIKTHIKQ